MIPYIMFFLMLLCKSINLAYGLAWNTVVTSGLVFLGTTWNNRYVRYASLELLARRQNVASLSILFRYYFGRCSSELTQLFPLPYYRGRSSRYSDRLHDFSVTIPRCYKDVYIVSFLAQKDSGILYL